MDLPTSSTMISMKFTKTKASSRLQDSKIRNSTTQDDSEERDFVTSVDKSNQIHGTKKKVVKEPLIIPLITRNEWRLKMDGMAEEAAATSAGSSSGPSGDPKTVPGGLPTPAPAPARPPLSLEDQAVQELLGLSSSHRPLEEGPSDIPLLLQNQVPSGYEEEDNMDVSLRPDASTLDDYERVPVDEFGMAMLRGMGWSKKEGIGLKNKQHVEIAEPVLRPKGLGLGASVSGQAKKDVAAGAGTGKEEELVFRIGAGAVIQKGGDKGMYGKIEAFDEDNNRVVIKLAISGKMAAVSKFQIVLVSEAEYKGKSKVLNYNQYAEYKEKQDVKEKERRSHEATDSKSDHNVLGGSSSGSSKRHKKHDDHLSKSKSRQNGTSSSSSSKTSKSSHSRSWVRAHLKVRFIDKKYKNGRHYEKKFIVEDVIAHDRFNLRANDTLLEDINSSQIETVIPKVEGSSVSILHGGQKGRIGELVSKGRGRAIVKIPDEGVLEFDYDDICEFVGDPEEYF